MKPKIVAERFSLHLSALCLSALLMTILLAGCGGGGLKVGTNTDTTFIGETPSPGDPGAPPPNQNTINVRMNLDISPAGAVSGTVVTTTVLGTFSVNGTLDANGRITGTGVASNGVTASFEGILTSGTDGTRTISGRINFSNGQKTDVVLRAEQNATPAPTPTPGAPVGPGTPVPTPIPTPTPTAGNVFFQSGYSVIVTFNDNTTQTATINVDGNGNIIPLSVPTGEGDTEIVTGTISPTGVVAIRITDTVNGVVFVPDQMNTTLTNQNGVITGSGQLIDTDPFAGDPSVLGTFTMTKL